MTGITNHFRCAATSSLDRKTAADELLAHYSGSGSFSILFVSRHYAELLRPLVATLAAKLDGKLIGCMGEAIVVNDREFEDAPMAVLWFADIPGAKIDLLRLQFEQTPDGGVITGWPNGLPDPWPKDSTLIAFAEPYSFPADLMMERLNEAHPGVRVIGGMASGGAGPGDSRVIFGDEVSRQGATAVLLRNAKVQTVVSQGCRPIGEAMVITKAERNVIHKLGGRTPEDVLREVFDRLPNRDKDLLRRGIHIGRVVNEYQANFHYGDFLVRHVAGMDEGSLIVGDYMRVGQTIQFHVRDGSTADDDLRHMLSNAAPPATYFGAALLFSCNGRGTRMFDEPHHDASVLAEHYPAIPTAGFFCQGEMGPVGGKNFLHGFTASIALFEA